MLEHWYAALHSSLGIKLTTTDPKRLIQQLYIARRKALDPDLQGISVIISPGNPNELWLVKNGKKE